MGFGGCVSLGTEEENPTLDSEIAVFNELDETLSVAINAFSNDERILHRTIEIQTGKGNETTSITEVPSQVSIESQQISERTIDIDVKDSCTRVDIGIWVRGGWIEHDITCLS
ncbi:hypothetical protein Huta_2578 [Halorhabdus utahensis DSM 12940]|uniref:Uncharacterized protein n=2 Tax=Halorhabdus utahensis TaxID=146826 RepID=C7NPI5_HALUD|nr:hypothetical protein Huta_2578 [Halorhabdus utahensis DSM 12940]